ncbi:UDP-N-acetylmuramoyl-L-alanine--D-glutamate ligase [Bacillus aquiflavi]|uniref:UDP-N-acetylmuramoylalanine--D-glutamate ligase n=1 Tax=Bacillus aquiflavi TaxID=2672567 RepID=A0A6B3VX64_9BACI|nr:UDP-N-acetylmuramoyl-L-alanine--D-glutamate ligase [Bacillus aquiflavi]MBA4537611.1 UDP-N-acetylmuramoyl-L-alanine--D-glutamate ligase [Bacillus aquiflavi]NEY81868.1 UDP-N-acetylmuramoyl-L-alanine--D-glutamate ligase [Bacillus aquiflavi]
MKQINDYRHRKILVLGLAKSGVSAASLLHKLGAFVTVNDKKPFSENVEAQRLLEQGIKVICGEHPIELLDEGFELVVKNPGIPYNNPIVKKAEELHIPIITEVELAYQISEAPFIAITGTNGKTTTTTLIYEMLKAAEKKVLIAGNIGTVASDVAQTATDDQTIVLELSSFQLMGIDTFNPKVAILTNIYDAHLDYHGTRKEYVKAKGNITKNQAKKEYFIVNYDQAEVMEIAHKSKAMLIPFSTKEELHNGVYVKDNAIFFNDEKIIQIEKIALPGKHNLENILCAIAAAKLFNISNNAINTVLHTFRGVKHRLQFIEEINGRKFYNDSKATNILATTKALQSFTQPVVLLAGGLDRGNEFTQLIPYLNNVKALITFGQTAEKLEEIGRMAGIKAISRVDNVEEAVPKAYALSNEGDVILLSPACASWDQYKTFEIRGDIFIKAVHKLK